MLALRTLNIFLVDHGLHVRNIIVSTLDSKQIVWIIDWKLAAVEPAFWYALHDEHPFLQGPSQSWEHTEQAHRKLFRSQLQQILGVEGSNNGKLFKNKAKSRAI